MSTPIPPEKRAEIIATIKERGLTFPSAAAEFGITEKTIRKWIRKRTDNSHGAVSELQKVKRERDFLKEIVIGFLLEKESVKKNHSAH